MKLLKINGKALIVTVCGVLIAGLRLGALEKYEPQDGSIYYGYCASGYWSEEALNQTLDRIYTKVSDKPFLLYSFFVHAKESGRWNGWKWRAEGPNGLPVHGSGDYLKRVRDRGFVPVVAWTWMDWKDHSQSPTIQGLLRGEYDWYLDEWIEGLKEFRTPIFIRLSHEMDGYWYPYSEGYTNDPDRNTAEDYIAYWRYVVDRFRAAGVDNVAWVWCVSGGRSGKRDWVDYYPGDEYVDWIAADIYSNRDGAQTLKELKEAMGTNKPIMIPEGGTEDLLTAYNTNYQGNVQWIKDFYGAIVNDKDSQVKAVCWFHWNEYSYVDRDPNQIPVYRDFIERDTFINVLQSGDLTQSADSLEPRVVTPEPVVLSGVGSEVTVEARLMNFTGETGCKWSIDEGSITGLSLSYSDCTARILAKEPGKYRIKVQAWNKQSQFAYSTFEVTVLDGGTSDTSNSSSDTSSSGGTGINIVLSESLNLQADGYPVSTSASIQGFKVKHGTKWSILEGDPSGLLLSYQDVEAVLTPLKSGSYTVKMEAWDSDNFLSKTMLVEVMGTAGYPSEGVQLVVPENVELDTGGIAKTIEAYLSGFSSNFNGNWKLESGDPNGISIVDNLSTATVMAVLPGEYTIKVEFWDAKNYKSAYIKIFASGETGISTAQPSIIAPDWVEVPNDGRQYQLEAAVVGFTPKGYRWSLESGNPNALSLSNDKFTAYLKGSQQGDFIIKLQAWRDSIFVSKHIRVAVVPET